MHEPFMFVLKTKILQDSPRRCLKCLFNVYSVYVYTACIKFLYDRQQLPAQCEVEVGGDYYYIGPQRAGPPDRYES